jgi:hypothetical protein
MFPTHRHLESVSVLEAGEDQPDLARLESRSGEAEYGEFQECGVLLRKRGKLFVGVLVGSVLESNGAKQDLGRHILVWSAEPA